MDKTTVELANKLYFDLHMGIEASEAMIPKVQNNHLKEYLNTHVNKYKQIQDDVVKQFTRSGKKPKSTIFFLGVFFGCRPNSLQLEKAATRSL